MEMARSMLHEKHLPRTFWVEVVYTAVYILNRCPTKAIQNMTLIEAWSGKKPSVYAIRRHIPSRDGMRSQQAPGSPRRPPRSEEIEEETPSRRTKLLSDIYETCNFVMKESENFEITPKHKV
ncbi:UNVERIFIED_CONTAM: hypothetical protein Slati_2933700 [Sesamum latifolium]|uniref:Uncharacterized protein n=1 Tax=Sesamum latifolium TaxID=2727402 RepID=A0AAW2VF44_9LAMI